MQGLYSLPHTQSRVIYNITLRARDFKFVAYIKLAKILR